MNIKSFIAAAIGIAFDPSTAAPGPRRRPTQRAPHTKGIDAAEPGVHTIEGVRFHEVPPPATARSEWQREHSGTIRGRVPAFTDADLSELHGSGLLLTEQLRAKAVCIKVKWAKGLTNAEIADELTAQYGRGFRVRTVETFTACYNRANGE